MKRKVVGEGKMIQNGEDEYGVFHNHPEYCFTEEHYWKGCIVHEAHLRWWQGVIFYTLFYALVFGTYSGIGYALWWVFK